MLNKGQVLLLLGQEIPAFHGLSESDLKFQDVRVAGHWIAQYSVRLAEADNLRTLWLSLHHYPEKGFRKAAEKLTRRLARLPTEERLSNYTGVYPEHRLLIIPFPLDLKLRALAKATEPAAICDHFFRHFGSLLNGARSVRTEPLRYVPQRRCQIRYRFELDDQQEVRILGKLFRDHRGRRLASSMNRVASFFQEGNDPSLKAAPCLGYLPGWKMVLQAEAPGDTLYDRIINRIWRSGDFRQAARCIARLHCLESISESSVHLIEDELHIIERSLKRSQDCGLTEPKLAEICRLITAQAVDFRDLKIATIHRDYYDKQVLVSDRTTTLIDLDSLANGPPEIDVANFCAHIHLRAFQGRLTSSQASRLQAVFLKEYVACRGEINLDCVSFLEAVTCFRLACKYGLMPGSDALVRGLLHTVRQKLYSISAEHSQVAISMGSRI